MVEIDLKMSSLTFVMFKISFNYISIKKFKFKNTKQNIKLILNYWNT